MGASDDEAPREMSARVKPKQVRAPRKPKGPRPGVDPRFDALIGGKLTPNQQRAAAHRYAFVNEIEDQECSVAARRRDILKAELRRRRQEEEGEEPDTEDENPALSALDGGERFALKLMDDAQVLEEYRGLQQRLGEQRSQNNQRKREDQKRSARAQAVKAEVQAVVAGKKKAPYFPKRSEKKSNDAASRFEALYESGGRVAVERAMEKRAKRTARGTK